MATTAVGYVALAATLLWDGHAGVLGRAEARAAVTVLATEWVTNGGGYTCRFEDADIFSYAGTTDYHHMALPQYGVTFDRSGKLRGPERGLDAAILRESSDTVATFYRRMAKRVISGMESGACQPTP